MKWLGAGAVMVIAAGIALAVLLFFVPLILAIVFGALSAL